MRRFAVIAGLYAALAVACPGPLWAKEPPPKVSSDGLELKKQTDFDFLYNNATLKNAKPVTLDIKNLDLKKVLDLCFEKQPFDYKIRNKTVLITAKRRWDNTLWPAVEKWQVLKGVVRDSATNETLIGVSIMVEGRECLT